MRVHHDAVGEMSLEDLLDRAETVCEQDVFADIRTQVDANDFTADTAIAVREALRRQILLAGEISHRLRGQAASRQVGSESVRP